MDHHKIGRTAAPAFLALSCVGFIASAPARAELPADAAADPAQDPRNDIIVNGAYETELQGPKATAKIVNTPRSVVVVPKEVIAESGSATLTEALRTVPGITFGAAEGGNPIGDRPFIRGYDSQGSIYLDGVRDIGSQSREVFAVEQVQIVRGSDSTLGGRGNAGGSINIISKTPLPKPVMAGTASYGTDDYKRVTADVNAPLGENIGVRVNAMWHDQDVAGRDAIYQKRWGIAPSFAIGLEGPTRLTASYYHLSTDELPDSGHPYLYTINNAPAGVTISEPVKDVTTANGRTGHVDRDTFYGLVDRDFRETEIDQATLRAEHDFGGVSLRNTARYTHTRQDYIFTQPDDSQGNVYGTGQVWRRANTRTGTTESLIDQLDLYGTVATGAIQHSFAVGGEIAWERGNRRAYVVTTDPRCTPAGVSRYNCTDLFAPNPYDPWVNYASATSTTAVPVAPAAPQTAITTDADTRSLYAFDSITLDPALILNLGIRYDAYETRIRNAVDATGRRPELAHSDDFVNWQAGLVFKPTSSTSLYASYATSSTPPGSLLGEGSDSNGVGASRGEILTSLDDLRAERSRNYEVGAKAELMGGNLALSLAGFRTETSNARVTGPDGLVAYAGERRVDGIELGVSGRILPGLNVFGGYTYLDARIADGGMTATTVNGVTLYAPSVNTGKRFPNTPEHAATLWASWEVTPALSVGGGAQYTSRVYGGYQDLRTIQNGQVVVLKELARSVPGYVRFDATAAYRFSPAVELRVNVQNVGDKRYYDRAYASHYASIAPGRSAFATLSFRY